MSGIALIWAANVKGLKPSAKIVLIQLADFHNKETGQCNPSAQRLADECEMGRSTVFRHMTELEESGLLTRVNRGDGKGGRSSSQYNLHLDIVLGSSSRHNEKSQIGTGGVVPKIGGKSPTCGTGVVPNRDRNLTIEPIKEPCAPLGDANTTAFDISSKLIEICPKGGDMDRTMSAVASLVDDGIDSNSLLSAMTAYASENEENELRYVRSTQSFLSKDFWCTYLPESDQTEISAMEKAAGRIKAHSAKKSGPLDYPEYLAQVLVQNNLITTDECRNAGILL